MVIFSQIAFFLALIFNFQFEVEYKLVYIHLYNIFLCTLFWDDITIIWNEKKTTVLDQ